MTNYNLKKFIDNVFYGNDKITTKELIEKLERKLERETKDWLII